MRACKNVVANRLVAVWWWRWWCQVARETETETVTYIGWLGGWLAGWLADEKAWICCYMEHVERASRKDVGFPFWAPSWALHIPHTNRCINYFFFVFTLFALYVALTHCDHECYRHKNFFSPISFSIVYLFVVVVVSAISFSVYLSYSHFSNWQSWREK